MGSASRPSTVTTPVRRRRPDSRGNPRRSKRTAKKDYENYFVAKKNFMENGSQSLWQKAWTFLQFSTKVSLAKAHSVGGG
jgi:hypothetical protein